jgi:hypothetical protein
VGAGLVDAAFVGAGFVLCGVRYAGTQPHQQAQNGGPGRSEDQQGGAVVAAGQDEHTRDGPDDRSDLVERLVHREAAAPPGGRGGV